MAHTPGPWDIIFDDAVERIRLNGSTVYQVADVTDPYFPAGQPRYNWADLRLMAAAPELLEALRSFIELHEDGSLHLDGSPSTEDPVITCARAAIAKAEGRN